ncbi:MAG: DUF488 domain-containing protein [Acidobacteria bacterium]|nr:DUF488 domain-containing protein [Acidobacteriota bacterium]
MTIYTIGHGRHAFGDFLKLLEKYGIEFLCDVRSIARSRWPQFNGPVLSKELERNRIGYEHLPECGGKTKPVPEELARGVDRIVELAADVRTVMMCSESQPLTKHRKPKANCHRIGLLSPLLKANGATGIVHILPNGDALEFDEDSVPSIW